MHCNNYVYMQKQPSCEKVYTAPKSLQVEESVKSKVAAKKSQQ